MARQRCLLVVGVMLGTVSVVFLLGGCGHESAFGVVDDDTSDQADYFYEIPPGSGDAIDRGEPLDIFPGSLEVTVGEVIELVNDDDRGHLVGPFFVGAHESVRHRFSSPGEFIGVCSVHPSGELVLTVRP